MYHVSLNTDNMKNRTYSVGADTTAVLDTIYQLQAHYDRLCTLSEDGELSEELQEAYDNLLQKEKEFLADGILNKMFQQADVTHIEL